jgi:hypothetical protein
VAGDVSSPLAVILAPRTGLRVEVKTWPPIATTPLWQNPRGVPKQIANTIMETRDKNRACIIGRKSSIKKPVEKSVSK